MVTKQTWRRIPKGTPNADGTLATFDYGALEVRDDQDRLIGLAHACNHGSGWTVSFTSYGLDCQDQHRAEALAEVVAVLLPKWHKRLVAEGLHLPGREVSTP
jgi:hypothetical protein